ncbi:hypothetical protein B0H10DRAFT_2192632 [Mycena sp. CBHHK59/15]|nr:hypothetical protein B0H10DRAFT_2192632 [Mycena sp. CBHHK59/15]
MRFGEWMGIRSKVKEKFDAGIPLAHARGAGEQRHTEESIPSVEPGTACKLFFFIIATLLFAAYIHTFQRDLVSPSKPLLENVGACLMFGVRGLEILFILALVIRAGIWVKDICIPHVGEGVELEPDGAQRMKEEHEAADAAAAAAEEAAPPQPVPCIGMDQGANIPFTEEQAEEATKIALERAALSLNPSACGPEVNHVPMISSPSLSILMIRPQAKDLWPSLEERELGELGGWFWFGRVLELPPREPEGLGTRN